MKCLWLSGPMLTLAFLSVPAEGAGDTRIASLALCRQSWLDWENTDPSALGKFGDFLRSNFAQNGNDGSFTPKAETTIEGLKVTQVFPGSVGMGVGFSVVVDASFEETKHALERDLGKPLSDCQASDGMRTCELSIAEQRTVMLVSNDPPNDNTSLFGCYYFYEK